MLITPLKKKKEGVMLKLDEMYTCSFRSGRAIWRASVQCDSSIDD